MNFRLKIYPILSLVFCYGVCSLHPSFAADDSNFWTVKKLNSTSLDTFAGVSKIRVEGLIARSSGSQFWLSRCDVVFTTDKQKLQSTPLKSHVEIKGHTKKEGSKYVFVVEEMKVVSSYADQFDLKATSLTRAKPEDWIELGEWAKELAQFYDDDELSKRASKAYSNALDTEYRSLKPDDADGRFELAKKIPAYQLSSRRQSELIHDGYRVRWQSLQKNIPPDPNSWRQFATTVKENLSGANQPITQEASKKIKESYDRDPIAYYRDASDENRRGLHRLFFVSILHKIIVHGESDDGRDGDSIADQIDETIPEEHATAQNYRLKRLEFGLRHIATATQAEAENLATRFRERGQFETATQALTDWIQAHKVRLKADGVVGLLRLADEYRALVNDEANSVECLMEASRIDPTHEEVRNRLTSLGYQLLGTIWVKSKTAPNEIPKSQLPITASSSSTEIKVGMTASALKGQLGTPRSILRTITGRGITEVWSFGSAGTPPLVIRLEQPQNAKEPKVSVLPL